MSTPLPSRSAPPGPSTSPPPHHIPIPPTLRTLVQNLKEIVRHHSDDEIYAALKESNMDPDDAVHKLMHQDTFHEVKRRRDRKREHGNNNEPAEEKERIRASYTKNRVDNVRRNLMNDSTVNKEQDQIYKAAKGNLQLRGQQFKSSVSRASNRSNARLRPVVRNGRQYPASQAARKSWTRVSVRSMRINPKQNGTVSATMSSLAGDVSDSVKATSGYSEASTLKQEIADSCMKDTQEQEQHISDGTGPVSVKSNDLTSRQMFERKRLTGSGTSQSRDRYFSVQRNKVASGGRTPVTNYYRKKMLHQLNQQPQVVSRQASSGLQWKPKPNVSQQVVSEAPTLNALENDVEKLPSSVPVSVCNETPKPASPKQGKQNLEDDDRPVIIPKHLQVPEAESAGLSFGSLDMDFEMKFTSSLNLNDLKHVNSTATTDILSEQQTASNVTDLSTDVDVLAPVETMPPTTAAEMFVTSNDAVLSVVSDVRPSEISKPESLAQQSRPVSYVQTLPNYQGFAQPQYPYESGESQSHGVLRLPNFVPSFTDPTPNYFSPVFHPGSDADVRHQFLSSNTSSKFSGNVSLTSGQTLSSSQEVSQNVGVSHATTLAMGQPSLQVHAYAPQPAAVTISPYGTNVYGYQYMPPNYAFMPTPNYGNNGYPQPPIGSSFTSGARGYPPVGTTLKYPATQYKLGTTNTPHALVATGYGGFATPSGFTAINSTVTASSGSSYDDMIGSQYKDNSLYTSSHQMEGSAVWVQAPLSRDPSVIQTNSYYNLHTQGQHAGYTHAQPTHAHPTGGFTNYGQSGAGQNNHQLLQQPLALGSVGFGSHSVIFPSSQRGQVNWTNNYSARNQQ